MSASIPRLAHLAVLFALTTSATACKDSLVAPNPIPTSISIMPAAPTLDAIGAAVQLTAVVLDQNNQPIPGLSVTWIADNDPVATVSVSGQVTAVTNGTATVTASSGSLQASVTVTVQQIPAAIVAVSGDVQSATVGSVLADFVGQVNDANGNPIADVSVTIAATMGGGSLSATSVLTDLGGQFTTTATLGPSPGNHTFTASITTRPDVNRVFTATASSAPGAGEFTVVVIPDTQGYSNNNPQVFNSQTQWIVDNRLAMNIAFVAHVGDIVNTRTIATEWVNANFAMQILDDDHIPYGALPGNHDFAYQDAENFYQTHFPSSRNSTEPWWGGSIGTFGGYDMGENNNNFQLVSAGGFDFIFLNLQWLDETFLGSDATYDGLISQVIAWADGVLTTHADRHAIVTTHGFLNNVPGLNTEGRYYWNNLIKRHDNVRLVLSGHIQVKRAAFTNDFGSTVWAIQQNWQGLCCTGGNGYLRYYTFKPSENTIEIFTYSTYADVLGIPEFLTENANQFVINYTF